MLGGLAVTADLDEMTLAPLDKGYVDREDALRDLGVSEDALEPIAP